MDGRIIQDIRNGKKKMIERIFDLTKHRELWDWLSKNPDMEKRDWPGWKKYAIYDAWECFYCFACRAVIKFEADWGKKTCLGICPLFPQDCEADNSLYKRWARARTRREKTYLAKQIRDIKPGASWTCI